MIRPTLPEDRDAILEMTRATEVFYELEIEALGEVLDDYHAGNHEYDHKALTLLHDDQPIGFAYHAPTAMTDRTWELWWIVVAKNRQGEGHGNRLLDFVESDVLSAQGRLLLIETSSLAHYEPTRRFYRKHGYREVARIPDFYADGDDKVIFHKAMVSRVA